MSNLHMAQSAIVVLMCYYSESEECEKKKKKTEEEEERVTFIRRPLNIRCGYYTYAYILYMDDAYITSARNLM